MKKLRIIVLIGIIILLSGCSGAYNLKINDDFSIDENLNIIIDIKNEDTYDKTKQLFDKNKISKKKYKLSASNDKITIDYKESYTSIEDYLLNSKLYHQLFDNINYSYYDGILRFKTNSKMLLQDNESESIFNNYDISMFQINLETPFKIKKSNADLENDNTISWTLNKDTKNKDINIEYNVTGSRNSIRDILILSLIGFITIGFIVFLIIRFKNSKKI